MGAVVALICGCAAGSAGAQVYTYQQTLGVTGTSGSDNGHFNQPSGIGVDSVNGHILISDSGNARVQVYDSGSLAYITTLGVTGATGSDNSHFYFEHAPAIDPNTGHVFVPDTGNDRIQVFDSKTFAYVATIGVTGVTGTDNAHLNDPVAVKVNPATRQIYVADYGNSRVQIFDSASFAYIGTIGTTGSAGDTETQLNQPFDVAYNPYTNQIMVADSGNHRVELFDPTTFAYVGTFGGPGGGDEPVERVFVDPDGLAVDPGSNVFLVADYPRDRVQVYDALTNNFLLTLGTTDASGSGNTQFNGAAGVAVDNGHNRLYVADAENHRVQVFAINSSPVNAAVLPGSRSVEVGNAATIYATMLNSGSTALSNCQVALPLTAPAGLTMSYQTTNPSTNALTGTPNTPATIAGNDGYQTFVLTFKSTQPFNALGLNLDYSCGTVAPAVAVGGVNTVDLIESSTPTPDIIALAATITNNGVVEVPLGSTGAFAVATDNLGIGASITASVNTDGVSLPLNATICQSNPSTGACLAPAASSVTLTDAAGATPTFSIFVASNGTAVPFNPANSRIFVQFQDSNGLLHGSTSVAVETQ